MKTPFKLAALAICAALLAGCASVPATDITVNPRTGAVRINSPKDVEAKNFKFKKSAAGVEITFDSLSSRNSADVILAQGERNAQQMDRAIGLLDKVGSKLESLVEKAGPVAAKAVLPVP